MNKLNTGKKGKSVNRSVPSRAMNIEPDKGHINQFDEDAKRTTTLRNIFLIICLCLATLASYLLLKEYLVFGSILAVVVLFLIFLISNINNTAIYKSGLIVPAIVVNTNPITIVVLADMRSDKNKQKIIWGCKKLTINTLPNHKVKLGEKVPCVTMFGMAVDGYHQRFAPRPLSWGFQKAEYLPKAVDLITKDTQYTHSNNQWDVLKKLTKTMNEIDQTADVIFFDEQLNKITMKK